MAGEPRTWAVEELTGIVDPKKAGGVSVVDLDEIDVEVRSGSERRFKGVETQGAAVVEAEGVVGTAQEDAGYETSSSLSSALSMGLLDLWHPGFRPERPKRRDI